MEKRILIGCPTCYRYRYCIDSYLDSVKKLDYANYTLLFVDNSPDDSLFKELKEKGVNVEKIEYCEPARERIVNSRNFILDKAIKENYDYLLSLEQDIIVAPDTIKRLLACKKEIVSAYYGKKVVLLIQDKETGEVKKVLIELPVVYFEEGNTIRRANPNEVLNKGIIEVGAIGLGCILISREVFKKIRFRYEKSKPAFDDMYFSEDVRKLGYKIYLCSDVDIKHLHIPWENIEK